MGKEKKEIGKLLKLLNEYDSSNGWKETEEGIDNIWKIYEFHSELQIISKKYGFIKRLVENDKIYTDKIEEKSEYTFIKNGGGEHIIEDVLMLLSISDTPIDDLISYLR